MDCSTPGFPVLHYLPEFAQTHVHWVGDAIQPSHPLSSPSPPALSLSQHQGLFQWVSSSGGQSIGASASASVLPRRTQGWLPSGAGWISLLCKGLSRVSSSTTVQNISSSALCLLYHLTLISVRGYWRDHSFDYAGLFCKVMSLLFNVLSRFIVTFLPGSILLISCWQSPSALISELRKRESVTASTFSPSICHEVMGLDALILVF